MPLFNFVNMEGVQPEVQNVTFRFLKNPKRGKDEIRVSIKLHIICITVDLILLLSCYMFDIICYKFIEFDRICYERWITCSQGTRKRAYIVRKQEGLYREKTRGYVCVSCTEKYSNYQYTWKMRFCTKAWIWVVNTIPNLLFHQNHEMITQLLRSFCLYHLASNIWGSSQISEISKYQQCQKYRNVKTSK